MDYQIDILEKLYNMSSATFSCGFAELVFSANNRGRCQTLHQKRSKVKTRKEKQLRWELNFYWEFNFAEIWVEKVALLMSYSYSRS